MCITHDAGSGEWHFYYRERYVRRRVDERNRMKIKIKRITAM